MNQQQQTNLVSGLILLIVAMLACSLAQASPMASSNQNQDQDDFSGGEEGPSSVDRHGRNQPEADNDFGGTFTGSTADLSGDSSMDQYQQQPQQYNFNGNSYRPSSSSSSNYNQQQQQQALASENNENQADDDDANEDDDSAGAAAEFEVGSNGGRRAIARALSESAQPWLESSMASADSSSSPIEGVGELEGAIGADSNIANAKIEMSPHDRATAAGHHHHHGHYVHGWLKMGAETGKKGAFKWHDKHPVGGKGRR